jgi:cytochrome c
LTDIYKYEQFGFVPLTNPMLWMERSPRRGGGMLARAKRFITLQDRIEKCFLYSMNGKAPDYTSPEMIATTAYIAFLSRGAVVGCGFPDVKMPTVIAVASPNPVHGAAVYGANCSACHGANGAGITGAFPAL